MNLSRLNQWIHDHSYTGSESNIDAQIQQTKARIFLTIASLTYVIFHGDYFDYYMIEALAFTAFYFIANIKALFKLRSHHFSNIEIIVYALLDITIVTFGMLIDGGHTSGVYFMLLVIIIGNGLRFGNGLLLFAQGCCIIWLFSMTTFSYFNMQMRLDPTLLFWQTFTLLAVPFYVFLIGKKLEKAVKDKLIAEESSFQLIDKGPMPVFTFDPLAETCPSILYANTAVYKLFQYESDDIIGEPFQKLFLPEDNEEAMKLSRATIEGDKDIEDNNPFTIYIRGKDSAGEIIKLMASTIRMRWHDRWIGVCFLLDVTERETLQEQMEAVQKEGYMSTLVAGIVHDFRNVLTNMIGNAEVLEMNTNNQDEKRQIESIIEAGERGSDLITHLLKLSRNSERSQPVPLSSRKDPIQPIKNIIGLTRLQLPQNVQLTCTIDEPLPTVSISSVEIEQILLNLINNSMQAIRDQGIIEVNISGQKHEQALCITVTDNGEGISEENIDRVFKPFWTSRAESGGSGLGLTMIQRIVKRHQGKIDISSSPVEKSTVVRVTIPSLIKNHEETTPGTLQTEDIESDSKAEIAKAESRALHILIVDDMPDILRVHMVMLSRMGHHVETAESVDEAMSAFTNSSDQFDLIVTDYRMPGKDGLDLVEEIREYPSQVPILMITAFGEDEQLQRAGSYGVTLMNKPVTIEKMNKGINKAIQ